MGRDSNMRTPCIKLNANEFPDDFEKFVFMPNFLDDIKDLAENIAEDEDWGYKSAPGNLSRPYPILENYIKFTYKRIAEERKIAITRDELFACWNTGLVTENQEPVYMFLTKNQLLDKSTYWHFGKFAKDSSRELSIFGNNLPEMCSYFDDPSILVYDARKDLKISYDHIIDDNFDRFPEYLKTRSKYELRQLLFAAAIGVTERVKRNYKIAVPQYYQGAVQLLLPLCLIKPTIADVALVVERVEKEGDYFYRGNTIFPLDWAYNSARQIAKPGKEWLLP
jgi:hypothetical protein